MSVPFRIGVLQLSMEPLAQTVRMAQACERAGFDIFWLAEAYPWWRKHGFEARSSTAMTTAIATQTQRIVIGWGIISPYTRHPVQIAMEARVMQDAAGDGRFLLGLGASKIFMKEIGEGEKGRDVGPAVVMRESIEIIAAMLGGGGRRISRQGIRSFGPALQARRARFARARARLRWCDGPGVAAARGLAFRRTADGQHHHSRFCALRSRQHGGRRAEGRQGSIVARSGRGDCRQHQQRCEEGQGRRARNGGDVSGQQGTEHSRLGRRASAKSRAQPSRRLRLLPTPWRKAAAKLLRRR